MILPCVTRSARCWSMVCMPCCAPGLHRRVDLVGLALADEVADGRRRDAGPRSRRRGPCRRRSWHSVWQTTPCSAPASWTRTCCCWCGGKTSMMRSMVCAASCVCRVAKTRWPVSAAVSASRDGLQVAQLADQDDVGVLAQDVLERVGERLGVGADLALVDQRTSCAGAGTRSGPRRS